jgi:hypothetical protein
MRVSSGRAARRPCARVDARSQTTPCAAGRARRSPARARTDWYRWGEDSKHRDGPDEKGRDALKAVERGQEWAASTAHTRCTREGERLEAVGRGVCEQSVLAVDEQHVSGGVRARGSGERERAQRMCVHARWRRTAHNGVEKLKAVKGSSARKAKSEHATRPCRSYRVRSAASPPPERCSSKIDGAFGSPWQTACS